MRKKLRDVPIISDETAQTEPQRVDATKTVPLVAQTASVNAVPDRTSGDVEDRNRRVSRSLKHGDVILDLLNITVRCFDVLLKLMPAHHWTENDRWTTHSREAQPVPDRRLLCRRQWRNLQRFGAKNLCKAPIYPANSVRPESTVAEKVSRTAQDPIMVISIRGVDLATTISLKGYRP
jgi:hypothetical protein